MSTLYVIGDTVSRGYYDCIGAIKPIISNWSVLQSSDGAITLQWTVLFNVNGPMSPLKAAQRPGLQFVSDHFGL